MSQNMDCAVILAGGLGSRLKPYTTILPKPLMPVGNQPILEIVIGQLRRFGFGRVILAVGYRDALIRSYFGDGQSLGVEISYSKERHPMGTVGPLHLVADQLPESFLFMNGDLLTDLDFRSFFDGHVDSNRLLTLGVHQRQIQVADGVVEFGPDNSIASFQEKPNINLWASMGIYAMNRRLLDFVPTDEPFSMDDLILRLLSEQIPINAHQHNREWYDIGCQEDLEKANDVFEQDRIRFTGPEADYLCRQISSVSSQLSSVGMEAGSSR